MQYVNVYNDNMTATNMTPTDKLASSGSNPVFNENNGNDNEDKIVQEFTHLLDKSKQLFNGLR